MDEDKVVNESKVEKINKTTLEEFGNDVPKSPLLLEDVARQIEGINNKLNEYFKGNDINKKASELQQQITDLTILIENLKTEPKQEELTTKNIVNVVKNAVDKERKKSMRWYIITAISGAICFSFLSIALFDIHTYYYNKANQIKYINNKFDKSITTDEDIKKIENTLSSYKITIESFHKDINEISDRVNILEKKLEKKAETNESK